MLLRSFTSHRTSFFPHTRLFKQPVKSLITSVVPHDEKNKPKKSWSRKQLSLKSSDQFRWSLVGHRGAGADQFRSDQFRSACWATWTLKALIQLMTLQTWRHSSIHVSRQRRSQTSKLRLWNKKLSGRRSSCLPEPDVVTVPEPEDQEAIPSSAKKTKFASCFKQSTSTKADGWNWAFRLLAVC